MTIIEFSSEEFEIVKEAIDGFREIITQTLKNELDIEDKNHFQNQFIIIDKLCKDLGV
jgi:hypothetical protein